jgi:hypothetical protein
MDQPLGLASLLKQVRVVRKPYRARKSAVNKTMSSVLVRAVLFSDVLPLFRVVCYP